MPQRHDCHVKRDENHIDREDLEGAGYVVLAIAGMGCPNCANRVHNALVRQPGVLKAEVSLEDALATVALEPARRDVEALLEAVATADPSGRHHYRAVPVGAP